MLLTVQIVNYNSRENLARCLDSIQKNVPPGVETQIIIVNNESEKLSGETLCSSRAEIVEAGENLGFGRAHNLGTKSARGEYILFLNPDTEVLSGSLEKMLGIFAADEKIGIVGPALVSESGKAAEEHFGFRKTPFSLVKTKLFGPGREVFQPVQADWLSGAAMMVRKKLFRELGGFDENYFMYFEDVDLCLRAIKRGHQVIMNPEAKILHESGQSFSDNRQKKKYYYSSQDYYLRKHFGPWQAGAAKLLRLPYYLKNVYFE